MSSSPTETPRRRDDAPDGRLGRRGHRRRVEEAARRLGRARRDHRLDLDRQDRHRRRGARVRPRAGDPRRGRHDGRRRRRARAHRHRREAGRAARVGERRREGTSEADVALEAPGEAGELSGDTTESTPGRPSGARRRSAAAARAATRRSSCGSPPSTASTSSRSRAPAAAGACASPTCSPTSRERRRRRKSRRCTSRARTSPSRSRQEGRPRRPGGPAALAHAPVDRQGDDRLAADRGDVHDDHRGRPDPDRARPREDRADVAALRGPRDDRDAARVPVAQRDARGRDVHAVRRRQPRHRGLARRRAA